MLKKILVPTDFSPVSENAFQYAAMLAKTFHSEIIVLHAAFFRTEYQVTSDIAPLRYEIATEEKLKLRLKLYCESLSIKYDIKCKTVLSEGFAVGATVEYSKMHNVDLIVMGTTGVSGLQKVLMGTNTVAVIAEAPCPVLAIPAHATFNTVNNCLYAADLSDNEPATIRLILRILKPFLAQLHVVHVNNEDHKNILDATSMMNNLEELFVDKPVKFYLANEHTVKDGIDKAINQIKPDLLVVAAHKHKSFLEKIFNKEHTREFAYQTSIPLLVLSKQ